MATFLCSVAALAALVQAPSPAPPSPSDSLAALRERVARDSTDGAGWLLVGRGYLQLAADAHGRAHRAEADSAWARAALDTAEGALARAAELAGPVGASAAGDSARVLRVAVWAARSRLTWEESGIAAALDAWGPLPTDLRVPAVLEELGENLLRACPTGGALLTAADADSYAAWYMRFARGLRPDLLVLPLAAWRSDALLRVRLARARRRLAGGARETTPRVHQHGVRAAARRASSRGMGDSRARVGDGTPGEGAGRAGARLRLRRVAGGSRRPRPLGRSRARDVRPGRPRDARAVRAARHVQGGGRGADVSAMSAPDAA